jgi:hypothetical protein
MIVPRFASFATFAAPAALVALARALAIFARPTGICIWEIVGRKAHLYGLAEGICVLVHFQCFLET